MQANNYRYFDEYFLFKDSMVRDYLWYIKNKIIVFDKEGIPLGQGPPVKKGLVNYVYTPVGVANHGLFLYNDLIKNTNRLEFHTDKRVAFEKQVNWLIKNRVDEKKMSFWYSNYPAPEHGCKPPWRSALTQGLVLSLLLRAYHLIGNVEFSRIAERVANSMKTPISDGGFLFIDSMGDYWYQEYMGNCGCVLNGFIFAMWGVYDYYLYSHDDECKKIFAKCVDTLRKNLRRYDWRMGIAKWTVYDLKDRNPVTLRYHKMHVSLLKDLYSITKEKFLLEYAQKWENYLKQPNILLVNLSRHVRAQILKISKILNLPHNLSR